MKLIKLLFTTIISLVIFTQCSEDNDIPLPPNKREKFNTFQIILKDIEGKNEDIVLYSPNIKPDENKVLAPFSGQLIANSTYKGKVQVFFMKDKVPTYFNKKIIREGTDHQIFYNSTNNKIAKFTATDLDSNNRAIGIDFLMTTGNNREKGNVSFTLVHKPNKKGKNVSKGDITNAGGEIDLKATFKIKIGNEIIKEEINQMKITISNPKDKKNTIILTADYPEKNTNNKPKFTIKGDFKANTNYSGKISLSKTLNKKTVSITDNVLKQGQYHQIFYKNSYLAGFIATDQDVNKKPIGLSFNMKTGGKGKKGNLIFSLIYRPNKNAENVSKGDITNAGGEIEAKASFDIEIK